MATLASLLINIGVKLDGALKVESAIRSLRQRSSETAREIGLMNRVLGAAGRGFKSFAAGVSKGIEDFQGFDFALGNMTLRLGGVPGMALAAGKALADMAIGAGKAIFDLVDTQTNAADGLRDMSRQVGVGVEELQRLQHAAKLSGVSTEGLSNALKKFNVQMLDASKAGGGKAFKEALGEIGLNVGDLTGKSRTQQIALIADRLNGLGDAAKQSAIAAKLFGKSAGPEMAALLAEGGASIEAMAASARGLFTQEQADAADEFQDSLTEVKAEAEGLWRQIAFALLPAVKEIIQGVGGWYDRNKDLINQNIAGFADKVQHSVKGASDTISELNQITGLLTIQMGSAGESVNVLGATFDALMGPLTRTRDGIEGIYRALVKVDALRRQIAGGKQAVTDAPTERTAGDGTDYSYMNDYGPHQEQPWEKAAREARKRAAAAEARGAKKEAARLRKEAEEAERRAQAEARASAPTAQQVFARLRMGDKSAFQEQLRGIATGDMGSISPTVAVTFYNFDIDQHITSTDPRKAGSESAGSIRREFQRGLAQASQTLQDNRVR